MAHESHQTTFFFTDHVKKDLRGQSVRGGLVTMLAQGVQFLFTVGSTVVLARLLTPQNFGLIAMVVAITGFLEMFKDLGLSMATIQKAEINHEQVSTLFWTNVLLGLLIMVLIAALSPVVAWLYAEPRLIRIALALAGASAFGGLTVQHRALLTRRMRFGSLAIVQTVSLAAGIAAAIISAVCGLGYWSLVIMRLVEPIAGAILVWLVCGWRPGWPVRRSGAHRMLAFGGYMTGYNLVNYFAKNTDRVLLGRFCGSHVLGLYSKAYALFMLPITQMRTPLGTVAWPALSRLQDEPYKYAEYYRRFVSMLSFITMPSMGFLFVCSENIIRLLLGERWIAAIPIFRILSIAGFIQAVESTAGLVTLSSGRAKRFFVCGVLRSILAVGSFVAGLHWGACGVAAGFTIGDYLTLLPYLWYCFRGTAVSVAAFLRAIAPSAMASILSTALMFLIHLRFLSGYHDFVVIGLCLLVGVVSFLALLTIVPGGPSTLHEFTSNLFLVFRTSRSSQRERSPAVSV